MFENRVMKKRIYGPKMTDISEGLNKLHDVKLHNLYFLPNIVRGMRSKKMRLIRHASSIFQ
jgi:hypothetical protein